MKRYILSLVLTLVCTAALAGSVTPEKAGKVASRFAASGSTRSSGGVSLVWDGSGISGTGTRASGHTPFFVFNIDGGGFVIIAGDDAADPIVGFSETGRFITDDMPSNVRGWFEGYASQMEFLYSKGIEPSEETRQKWENWLNGKPVKASESVQLRTACWGQGTPFNNKCPEVDGNKAVTGCVATAMAEIMKFHKWPSGASGNLPGYEYETDLGTKFRMEGHALSPVYDWNAMPDTFGESYGSAAADAVSTLMYDLGVMLQASYNGTKGGASGTGAFSEDIGPMLVKYMSYDSSAICRYRNDYTYKEWVALMRSEIDAGRPVCYSGSSADGGHQFVLDGYGTDNMFYINWGWSGSDNGWFHLHAMNPDKYNFNDDQAAVVGIKPAKNGKGHPQISLSYWMDTNGGGGLKIESGKFQKGASIKVSATHLTNDNSGTIDGTSMGSAYVKYAVVHFDRGGAVKGVYGETGFKKLSSGYSYSNPQTFSFTVSQPVELGDKMMLCYKEQNSSVWVPVKRDHYYINGELGDTKLSIPDAVYPYDFPTIEVDPEGYAAGDAIDLRITGTNLVPFARWKVDGKEIPTETLAVKLDAGTHTIIAEVELYEGSIMGTLSRTETLVRIINVY